MPDVPIGALFAFLAVLIVVSALCSGAETAMMALNRYRLRYLADQGRAGARRAQSLLERPDRF
ncbi:MAG: CNNM domain-containing protein, partial [Gammaproteobacteria bacterium]